MSPPPHPFWLAISIGLFLWLIVGILYGYQPWIEDYTLSNYYDSIPPNQDKNPYLYGTDYLGYQLLQQTPLNTKILFVLPDINNYAAKAVYFLYPRPLTFTASIDQALNSNPETYDQVYVYLNVSEFSGYIQNPTRFQNTYPIVDQLVILNNLLNQSQPMDRSDIETFAIQNYGNFLYKIDHLDTLEPYKGDKQL